MRRQARLGALFGIGFDHEFRSLHTGSDLSLGEDDGLVRHGFVQVGKVGAESNSSLDDVATLEFFFGRFGRFVERHRWSEGNNLVPLAGTRGIGCGCFFGRRSRRICCCGGGSLLGRRPRRGDSHLGTVDGLANQFVPFLLPVNISAILKVLGVHSLELIRTLIGGNRDGANVGKKGVATGGAEDELAEGQLNKLKLLKVRLQLNKVVVDLLFLLVDIGHSSLNAFIGKGRKNCTRKLEFDESTSNQGVPTALVALGIDEDVAGTTHPIDNLAEDRTKSPHGPCG